MLTDALIAAAEPRAKAYKLYDTRGLFLIVTPCGGRWWRIKYRFDGKAQMLSLGTFPDVPLKLARERRDAIRRDRAAGIDPAARRRADKLATAVTFEDIAREWFKKFSANWVPTHADRVLRRLDLYLFPGIGARPIGELTARDILVCLQRLESRRTLKTAHRLLQNCTRIFRYAIATGRAAHNPAEHLRGAIGPARETHFAAITDPKEFGELLRTIDGYGGNDIVRHALRLAPRVFVRPGELRLAEWSDIDWEAAEWHIPAARMKMRSKHIVPLSRQSLAILRDLQPMTGHRRHLFASPRNPHRPISDVTLLAALHRMGYEPGTITVHGFRATASTILNEQGKNRDWIERQLAHGDHSVRAAYNYADYLPQRKAMMQEWSDYLDKLRDRPASPRLWAPFQPELPMDHAQG